MSDELQRLVTRFLTTNRRGSAVYRISRFPAPRSEKQRYAWKKGKEACLKGLRYTSKKAQEASQRPTLIP